MGEAGSTRASAAGCGAGLPDVLGMYVAEAAEALRAAGVGDCGIRLEVTAQPRERAALAAARELAWHLEPGNARAFRVARQSPLEGGEGGEACEAGLGARLLVVAAKDAEAALERL